MLLRITTRCSSFLPLFPFSSQTPAIASSFVANPILDRAFSDFKLSSYQCDAIWQMRQQKRNESEHSIMQSNTKCISTKMTSLLCRQYSTIATTREKLTFSVQLYNKPTNSFSTSSASLGKSDKEKSDKDKSDKEKSYKFDKEKLLHSSSDTSKDGLNSRDSVNKFLSELSDYQKYLVYHSLNLQVHRGRHDGSSSHESHQYLSRFGRPTAAPTFIPPPIEPSSTEPPTWLQAQPADDPDKPLTFSDMRAVGIKNALPFIGFGFLDNLIMILAGDYIDLTIGTYLGISTMAAAALGNTISDVAGIASAWYVEAFAERIGVKDPVLTPGQMNSWGVRWSSNLGRAIGVVIGCLLGMLPLLFLPSPAERENSNKEPEKVEVKKI